MTSLLPDVARGWLAEFGRTATTWEELSSSEVLAVQVKADFESNYGDATDNPWDDVSYEANEHVPELTRSIAEAYAMRHHASTYDLLVEAQSWLAGPSRRAAG